VPLAAYLYPAKAYCRETSDLRADMERLARGLRDSLEATGAIEHALTRGEIRETEVIDGLRPHLPARFRLATGEVVNADGARSRQQDVIVSDGLVGTPFLARGGIGVFPVEIVYATLQVKSRISVSTVADAIENVSSVKRLVANDPRPITRLGPRGLGSGETLAKPFGGIVAFASESKPEALTEAYVEANEQISVQEDRSNALVVFDELALVWATQNESGVSILQPTPSNATLLALIQSEALLFFYLTLRYALSLYDPPPLNLFAYVAGLDAMAHKAVTVRR
jgi:hypothetical protein